MRRRRYTYYEVKEFRKRNKQKSYYFNPKDSNMGIENLDTGGHIMNLGNPYAWILILVI